MSKADSRNGHVTGYPAPNGGYPVPDQPPPPGIAYVPYPAAPPTSNHPGASRLRRVLAFMIGLVILFGAAISAAWLVLCPRVPEFRVDSVSISNFTLGNNSVVSFTSEIRLTARNPNEKMSLVYGHIQAGICYRSEVLSETTVPPFLQNMKTETSLAANFAAAGKFVGRPVADAINGDRAENGNVGFNLRMLISGVRFQASTWRTWCGGGFSSTCFATI